MTIDKYENNGLTTSWAWKGRIPERSIFYDEIDRISRGLRATGLFTDRTA